MANITQIYWLTPAAMVGALLLGTMFALGHDLFYNSLRGKSVAEGSYEFVGSRVSRQQLNTAIGTAFAVLVKSSLVSAVSLAYLQFVWGAIRSKQQSITLANMDVFMSVLGNALSIANLSTWKKWPLLLLVALVAWLIPLASIVTPATLSVGIVSPPPRFLDVPNVALTGFDLMAPLQKILGDQICLNHDDCESITVPYYYNGPSHAVKRVVAATAAQGTILTVDAPASNSSWSIRFPGPSLKCKDVKGQTQWLIKESIANSTFSDCNNAPGYLAWTPTISSRSNVSSELPFFKAHDTSYLMNAHLPVSRNDGDTATLFIATVPTAFESIADWDALEEYPSACKISKEKVSYKEKVSSLFSSSTTMLRCDLYNSTYQADFRFIEGKQDVSIKVADVVTTPISTVSKFYVTWDANDDNKGDSHCDALTTAELKNATASSCVFDSSILTTLSYQSIMDAFTDLLVGRISIIQNSKISRTGLEANTGRTNVNANTSITSTVLARTPELNSLLDMITEVDGSDPGSLQTINPPRSSFIFHGLSNGLDKQSGQSLRASLETLFQNITISLMSSPQLQFNKSSAFSPPKTKVTFSTTNAVYVYDRSRLWLVYGIAIGLSMLPVAFAFITVYLGNPSFSNNFSSILRLSRGAEMSVAINKEDLDGRDPLPEYLKHATLEFQIGEADPVAYEPVQAEAGTNNKTVPDADSTPLYLVPNSSQE